MSGCQICATASSDYASVGSHVGTKGIVGVSQEFAIPVDNHSFVREHSSQTMLPGA
jgi:hypothetical protein